MLIDRRTQNLLKSAWPPGCIHNYLIITKILTLPSAWLHLHLSVSYLQRVRARLTTCSSWQPDVAALHPHLFPQASSQPPSESAVHAVMAPRNKELRHDSLNSPNVIQTALGSGKYEQSTHASDLGNLQDADEALQAVGNSGDAEEIAIEEELKTSLLRKIDLHIMPMMCIVYGLNYLDKTTLSYASIMGLETDLDLTKSNYQWLGSVFYIGYLGFEYPTSRLLQRLPLAKYSAFNIILWGLTLSCTAATSDFAGIASVRLILGMCEAAVTPGFVLFTSQWYTKKEQGLRTGIWFSFNGFANVLGGLVAYGVAQGTSSGRSVALAGWKILFLVWGLITMATGIIFLLVMPDSPLKARFLSTSERRLVIERTRHNQQGEDFRFANLLRLSC